MERKLKIKILLICLAVAAVVTAIAMGSAADEPDGSTPESIIGFLNECGYTVASPVTKEITIPEEFGDVYENYNKLQKEQGFDLSRYKGESALSYTFPVIGYIGENGEPDNTVQAHIIVLGGRIIGGDIASTRLDGFMKGVR